MTSKQSRIIGKVLSPAVQLWLRSQVERVENLEVKIAGGDRQILSGHVPRISLSTSYAVYQGLHISSIELVGESIHINLGQILKGKPLRLLQPIPVTGQLRLEEADLAASLSSPLLISGLNELLSKIFPSPSSNVSDALCKPQVSWHQVLISDRQFTLTGTIIDSSGNPEPFLIRSLLQLVTSNTLRLELLEVQLPAEFKLVTLKTFEFDLGSQVAIDELLLSPRQIFCRGSIMVMP